MVSDSIFNTQAPSLQAEILHNFRELFRGNERGYGRGDFPPTFNEEKNKWTPKTRWVSKLPTEAEFLAHLRGEFLLGIGPLRDDNKVLWAALDVDKLSDNAAYEFDYAAEMQKIKNSGFPIPTSRSKSGGLRPFVFFLEPIEAELVVPRMKRLAAQLGYSGCEIFPKQTKLDVANGDCPSWIYLPYGGTCDVLPEQCGMNEHGNAVELNVWLKQALNMRISQEQFLSMFSAEEKAKANGRANGHKHRKGMWVEEKSYEENVITIFCDGPPCLWHIASRRCHDMQNSFLLNCVSFLKRKYPENWDKALTWINFNVLQPVGDGAKLQDMIKRMQHQDYNYRCKEEPIVSHCFSYACKRQPYGVGPDHPEDVDLGMTIVDTIPQEWCFITIGAYRPRVRLEDLADQGKYHKLCIAYGVPIYHKKKQEHTDWFNAQVEKATRIPPTHAMQAHAVEIELIQKYFNIHVSNFIRQGSKGMSDVLRVNLNTMRVHYKWEPMCDSITRQYSGKEADLVRQYQETHCEYWGKEGHGHWWRCTYSISLDVFDEYMVKKWLNPNIEEEEEEDDADAA